MNLLNILNNCLIYISNGVLSLIYLLATLLPALISLACGLAIILTLDRDVQERANFRPGRNGPLGYDSSFNNRRDVYQAPETAGTPRTAQILTFIVLALWLIAQTGMAAPVPWIGTAMWLAGLIVLFAMPAHQRMNMLWFVKTGLALYSILVIASRIYLSYTATLTAEQWASLIGSTESATKIIANTRGNATTIIMWALWLIGPLGYFSLMIQKLFVNPMNLVSPLRGANEVLQRIRQR